MLQDFEQQHFVAMQHCSNAALQQCSIAAMQHKIQHLPEIVGTLSVQSTYKNFILLKISACGAKSFKNTKMFKIQILAHALLGGAHVVGSMSLMGGSLLKEPYISDLDANP